MTSFNKVILIGNLTRDPEMRYTPSGTAVTTLSLAMNHRYKQGDEQREDVCYVDVVVFGRQAETCSQYLNRGSGVIVDGRLSQRRWEAEDGSKRSKHEVVAQNVRFMPRKGDAGGGGDYSQAPAPAQAAPPAQQQAGAVTAPATAPATNLGPPDFTDDDIPF